MDLAPYIKELILHNECIILPDFGGFESSYIAAQYDPTTKQMLPPSKKVEFKSEYSVGGEVLENYLSENLRIKQEQAKDIIKEYVRDIKHRLSNNETVYIGGIGQFTPESANEVTFTAIRDENYLVESFGLEPLAVEEIQIQDKKAEIKEQVIKITSRNNTLTFVIIGIFIICILLFLTIFISAKFDIYFFNIGDNAESSETIIFGGDNKDQESFHKIKKEIEEFTTVKQALYYSDKDEKNSNNDTTIVSTKKFLLVAGSFKSYHNAGDLEKKLLSNGFKTEIVEAGGYYRVCVGSFRDKTEAINELQRIRRQIEQSVWLLTVN